ncbi:MAG: alpha/beta hydrolase, partial [Cyclobacteriaceae bacterium]
MKSVVKIVGGIILIAVLLVGIIYFFFPQYLVALTNANNAKAANLEAREIVVGQYRAHYYAGGNTDAKDTLVLLHGLGDEKNSFVQAARYLKDDYFLILPDLLASGENLKLDSLDLSIEGQVVFLHRFLSALGIEKFHLAGNSMGGHVSAAYAIRYPQEVRSLVLLNAAGLKLDDHVVYTGFGKEIANEEELNVVMQRVFYKVPEIPGPVKKLFIRQINESRIFLNQTIIPQIKNGGYFNLKDQINRIEAPTLILWGKHDKVVKFSTAERYVRDIPLSELRVIENAAHSPQLEVPETVSLAINKFIQKSKNMTSKLPATRE